MNTENKTPETTKAATAKTTRTRSTKSKAASTSTSTSSSAVDSTLNKIMGNSQNICKFEKQLALSNKEIISNRAAMFAASARVASEENVRILGHQKMAIEFKIADLQDLNISNNQSLKVLKDGFNAAEWIQELQDLKMELKVVLEQLEVAVEIHEEYFGTN